jgi:high-affinity iron transporter
MIAAGILSFREGLEAALIVGIVISYLTRIGHRESVRYAWLGIGAALALSVVAAMVLQLVGASLEEPYEQIYEGTMMLLAVAILTWMIFWMRYQGRFMKRDLEHKLQSAMVRGTALGIFGMAFLAVFREGIETALFLSASAFVDNGFATWVGALAGLVLAVAMGVAIYGMALRLDVSKFFDVTSVLLLVFAAGLFARSVHEFQEIGWLPFLTQPAWNLESLLPNESLLGSILRALVGYNAAPSQLEVVAYVGYWGIVIVGIRWWMRHLGSQLAPTTAQA